MNEGKVFSVQRIDCIGFETSSLAGCLLEDWLEGGLVLEDWLEGIVLGI